MLLGCIRHIQKVTSTKSGNVITYQIHRKTNKQQFRENEETEEYIPNKEQDKIPNEELNEVELGNLSEEELKEVTVKMVKKLEEEWDIQSKKLEVLKES